ncbi:hypothetical protein [[Clostridium] scindens]|nr:hypothetical protein [[Clostridium] scindens]NSI89810.1 hypothetical protein [[Clostridium] scindens]NSJ04995.1 hypothetical protein [[Clostridium] scindens]
MGNIKVEWCKNFIKSVFEKIPFDIGDRPSISEVPISQIRQLQDQL